MSVTDWRRMHPPPKRKHPEESHHSGSTRESTGDDGEEEETENVYSVYLTSSESGGEGRAKESRWLPVNEGGWGDVDEGEAIERLPIPTEFP